MRPEAILQRDIIRVLDARGAWGLKATQTGWGRRGTPDLSYTYRGHSLVLEVKPPGGRATDHQLQNLADARRAGAVAAIATSAEMVAGLLDQIDRLIEADFEKRCTRFVPIGLRVVAGHIPPPRIVSLDAA